VLDAGLLRGDVMSGWEEWVRLDSLRKEASKAGRDFEASVYRVLTLKERDRQRERFPRGEEGEGPPEPDDFSMTAQSLRDLGYIDARVLLIGYALGIQPLLFGRARLCCGCGPYGHDVTYDYRSREDALRAMVLLADALAAPPLCKEPTGWERCVGRSGKRYRPGGDPALEYPGED
jgi:hypothetical protein